MLEQSRRSRVWGSYGWLSRHFCQVHWRKQRYCRNCFGWNDFGNGNYFRTFILPRSVDRGAFRRRYQSDRLNPNVKFLTPSLYYYILTRFETWNDFIFVIIYSSLTWFYCLDLLCVLCHSMTQDMNRSKRFLFSKEEYDPLISILTI